MGACVSLETRPERRRICWGRAHGARRYVIIIADISLTTGQPTDARIAENGRGAKLRLLNSRKVILMEKKDRCELLLKLANFRMTRVASRRDHEWKVTLALWALLAAGIAQPPRHIFIVDLLVILIAIFGIHSFWVYDHWNKSKEDIYYSFKYTDAVSEILMSEIKFPTPQWPTFEIFLKDRRARLQLLTTILLAAIVLIRACRV
jgi:hypothetical protein